MFCHALVKHKPPATLPSGGTGQKRGTLMFDGRIGRADMRRIEMHEIHDLPTFPAPLRDLVTDGMQALWNFGNTYQPILSRLMASMKRARTREVLDLCSGGGGPWLRLVREPELQADHGIAIRLTDKYPNQSAFERASSSSGIAEVRIVASRRNECSCTAFRFSDHILFFPPLRPGSRLPHS